MQSNSSAGDRLFGTKSGSGVYQAIISQFPPHDTYIETHAGTGAILLAKPKAADSIVIDRDFDCVQAISRKWVKKYGKADRSCLWVRSRCEDFLAALNFEPLGRVLIYADPPYVHSTRSRRRYKFDYSDADHRALLALLSALPASVVISGYPSALYDEEVGHWRKVEFQAMTRGGVRTECLWMNFPADRVAWATYQGKDRIDRQRIKRKAATWKRRFQELPAGERCAILAALMEE